MKVIDLFNDIRSFCIANANPEIVTKYSRYFKEGYDAYGLTTELNALKTEEIFNNSDFNITLCYELAKLLVPTGKYEETSIALLLINKFKKEFDKITFENISYLFDIGIINWGHTDFISGETLYYFLKNKILSPYDFEQWILSDRKYKRRAVPVTYIKYIKDKNLIEPLLQILTPLMSDNDRVVHQGMGWFLREAWKINPLLIEDFLLKWENTAPRLIFQYACEKMTKDHKKLFTKEKKLN